MRQGKGGEGRQQVICGKGKVVWRAGGRLGGRSVLGKRRGGGDEEGDGEDRKMEEE